MKTEKADAEGRRREILRPGLPGTIYRMLQIVMLGTRGASLRALEQPVPGKPDQCAALIPSGRQKLAHIEKYNARRVWRQRFSASKDRVRLFPLMNRSGLRKRAATVGLPWTRANFLEGWELASGRFFSSE